MFSFLIGVLAGAGTPFAAPHIRTALDNIVQGDITMSDADFKTFSYAVSLMLGGAVVLFAGGGSGFALVLGGFLGLFGRRIYNTFRQQGGARL